MPDHSENIQNTQSPTLTALLHRTHDFLRYLDRKEYDSVLKSLISLIAEEKRAIDVQNTRGQILLSRILAENSYSGLRDIHDQLNELEMERFLATNSVTALHSNCTNYRDALANRGLALVTAEMISKGNGSPPAAYALISMGSDGRAEQTLITDQDYLIVYQDGGGEEADFYFKEFADLLVERLAEIGFKKCTGDIMPSNPTWRGSLSQWNKRLFSIVRYEYEDYGKNLMDLIVLSDARHVAGDKELALELIDNIRGLERDYFQVLWGMAKAATEMKLALGFLKRFWTEGSGAHKGEFNLKLLAWAPLVMNVRILAINLGIPETNTLARIESLKKFKSFSSTVANELTEAYHILTKHRILLQIKVIKGVQDDAYYINPYQLPRLEKERIRQALIRIEELQKLIHVNFNIV